MCSAIKLNRALIVLVCYDPFRMPNGAYPEMHAYAHAYPQTIVSIISTEIVQIRARQRRKKDSRVRQIQQ